MIHMSGINKRYSMNDYNNWSYDAWLQMVDLLQPIFEVLIGVLSDDCMIDTGCYSFVSETIASTTLAPVRE